MRLERTNKQYIGKVEAFEVCSINSHDMPKKNEEILHSRQVGLQSDVIGKDADGYYIEDVSVNGKMRKKVINKFGNHYLLGIKDGKKQYLQAPSWSCGWYWSFGYIHEYTNDRRPKNSKDIACHYHWDDRIVGKQETYDCEKQCWLGGKYYHHLNQNKSFSETVLTDAESWTLAELMSACYKLKTMAEVLGKGGSNLTINPCQEVIKNKEEVKRINEVVLPELFKEIDKILTPK